MKASDAKRMSVRAIAKQNKQLASEAARKEVERNQARDVALKTDYPKRLVALRKQIHDAAKSGRSEHSYCMSSDDTAGEEIINKLAEVLTADGYTCQIIRNFVPGSYENMGDFNAPCNIWRESCWTFTLSIEWTGRRR